MDLSRNTHLIVNACSVDLQSKYHNDILSDFTNVYGVASSINFTSAGRTTSSGVYYENKIEMTYPGLKDADFENFHALLHDSYYVVLKTDTKKELLVASENSEMSMVVSYSIQSGHRITLSGRSIEPVGEFVQLTPFLSSSSIISSTSIKSSTILEP